MPTLNWLKQEFGYGYDSGNITSILPNKTRRAEERKIGGSYRRVFNEAIRPYLNDQSDVLELGPGRGAWSRAILNVIPSGTLSTVDFQDVTEWLEPQLYDGRLNCHQVFDNSFSCIDDQSIDFFWSMGVLCHNNQTHIQQVLENSLAKLRPGGFACHQFADWKKLETYGWERGGVPAEFKNLPDDEIWWPRNNTDEMKQMAADSGWTVVKQDLELLDRDGLILLRRD